MVKGPGTSFQSPTLSQNILLFDHHVAMLMMMSEILTSVDFTKT